MVKAKLTPFITLNGKAKEAMTFMLKFCQTQRLYGWSFIMKVQLF